jgi:hypothetical protein
MTVPKETCVVWVNWVSRERVRINFEKSGKSCIRSTESPSGFKELEGCYLTEFLPRGKSASLVFKNPGAYKYQVEIPDKSKTRAGVYPGKIEVGGVINVE